MRIIEKIWRVPVTSARLQPLVTAMLLEMVQQNTQLTETVKALTERVETLTTEVHKQLLPPTKV